MRMRDEHFIFMKLLRDEPQTYIMREQPPSGARNKGNKAAVLNNKPNFDIAEAFVIISILSNEQSSTTITPVLKR